MTAKRPARRPAARTVHVEIAQGEYAGWEATARADFPARLLAELESGSIARILPALDEIVTDHNMPSGDDTIAERLADVDPYGGLLQIAGEILDAIGKLPNR